MSAWLPGGGTFAPRFLVAVIACVKNTAGQACASAGAWPTCTSRWWRGSRAHLSAPSGALHTPHRSAAASVLALQQFQDHQTKPGPRIMHGRQSACGSSRGRPITTFLPLAIVLGVSIFKEALEDMRRYQADCEVNARACLVLDPAAGAWQKRRWRDVKARPRCPRWT